LTVEACGGLVVGGAGERRMNAAFDKLDRPL